jgi:hypothetical protein
MLLSVEDEPNWAITPDPSMDFLNKEVHASLLQVPAPGAASRACAPRRSTIRPLRTPWWASTASSSPSARKRSRTCCRWCAEPPRPRALRADTQRPWLSLWLRAQVAQFSKEADWRYRHAALHALAQVAESMQYKDIPMREVFAFARADPHVRVRFAAVHCIGLIAIDFVEVRACGRMGECAPRSH